MPLSDNLRDVSSDCSLVSDRTTTHRVYRHLILSCITE